MAENRVTIDHGTIFDNIGDRQIEFAGDASGETYQFALRYDVLEALAGRIPGEEAMTIFEHHLSRIERLAAAALTHGFDEDLVVISENDLD